MLQRQGQLGPDGEQARPAPRPQQRPAPRQVKERVGPRQYLREVRGELRKVAWPSRAEVVRYSVIVLVTLILLTTFIFGLDYGVAKVVFFLFDQ